jgi:hypothetical protein
MLIKLLCHPLGVTSVPAPAVYTVHAVLAETYALLFGRGRLSLEDAVE